MPLSSLFKRQRAKFEVAETPAGIATQDLNVHGTKLKVNEGDYESNQKIKLSQGVELSLSGAKLTGRFTQSRKVTISGYGGRLHVDRDVLHSNETLDMTVGALEIRENSVFSDSSHYGSGSDKFYTKGNPGSITRVDFDGFLILNDHLQFVNEREYNLQKKEPKEKEAPTVVELENAELVSIPSMSESTEDQSEITEPTLNPKVVNTPSLTENPSLLTEIQKPTAQSEKVKHKRALNYHKELFDLDKYAKENGFEKEIELLDWKIFPFLSLSMSITPSLKANFDAMVSYEYEDEPPAKNGELVGSELLEVIKKHRGEKVTGEIAAGLGGEAGLTLTVAANSGLEKVLSVQGGLDATAVLAGKSTQKNLPTEYLFSAAGNANFIINDASELIPLTFEKTTLDLEAAAGLTATLSAFLKGTFFGMEKDLWSTEIKSWDLGDYKTGAQMTLENRSGTIGDNIMGPGGNFSELFSPNNNFRFEFKTQRDLDYDELNMQFDAARAGQNDFEQKILAFKAVYEKVNQAFEQIDVENQRLIIGQSDTHLFKLLDDSYVNLIVDLQDHYTHQKEIQQVLDEELTALIEKEAKLQLQLKKEIDERKKRIAQTETMDKISMDTKEKKALKEKVIEELTTPEKARNYEMTSFNEKTQKHRLRLIYLLTGSKEDFATDVERYTFMKNAIEQPETLYSQTDPLVLHKRAEEYKSNFSGFENTLASFLTPEQILDYEKKKVEDIDKKHDRSIELMQLAAADSDVSKTDRQKLSEFMGKYQKLLDNEPDKKVKVSAVESDVKKHLLEIATPQELLEYERSRLGLSPEDMDRIDNGTDMFELFTDTLSPTSLQQRSKEHGYDYYNSNLIINYFSYEDVLRYEEGRLDFYMRQAIAKEHENAGITTKGMDYQKMNYESFKELYGGAGSISEMLAFENKLRIELNKKKGDPGTEHANNQFRIDVLNDLKAAYERESAEPGINLSELNEDFMKEYINIIRGVGGYQTDSRLSEKTRSQMLGSKIGGLFDLLVNGDLYSGERELKTKNTDVEEHKKRIEKLIENRDSGTPFPDAFKEYQHKGIFSRAKGFLYSDEYLAIESLVKDKDISSIPTRRLQLFEAHALEMKSKEATKSTGKTISKKLSSIFGSTANYTHLTRYRTLKEMQDKPQKEVVEKYIQMGGGKGYRDYAKGQTLTPNQFIRYEQYKKAADREKHQKRVDAMAAWSLENTEENRLGYLEKYEKLTISDKTGIEKFGKQVGRAVTHKTKTGLDRQLKKEKLVRQIGFEHILNYELERVKYYGGENLKNVSDFDALNDQSSAEERSDVMKAYRESGAYSGFYSSIKAERRAIVKERTVNMEKASLKKLQEGICADNQKRIDDNLKQLVEVQERKNAFDAELDNLNAMQADARKTFSNPMEFIKTDSMKIILDQIENRRRAYARTEGREPIQITESANAEGTGSNITPQGDE